MKEVDLPNVLAEKNINVYNVKWSAQGIDPKQEQSHNQYIKNLCQDFYSVLTTMIENGISEKQSEESNNEEILDEVFQHGIFCQKKCKSFHGRKPFLENIKQEIENGSTTFILHGQSGCGKTSVMAKLASSVKKWIGDPKATLVLRFIGTTANSFAIRDLLRSICVQLYKATGHQMEEIPEVTYVNQTTACFIILHANVSHNLNSCYFILARTLRVCLRRMFIFQTDGFTL